MSTAVSPKYHSPCSTDLWGDKDNTGTTAKSMGVFPSRQGIKHGLSSAKEPRVPSLPQRLSRCGLGSICFIAVPPWLKWHTAVRPVSLSDFGLVCVRRNWLLAASSDFLLLSGGLEFCWWTSVQVAWWWPDCQFHVIEFWVRIWMSFWCHEKHLWAWVYIWARDV